MIKSMMQPMIRPMIKSMVNPDAGGGAITRFFAQLDDVLMSYYVYSTTLVFGASDTFEIKAYSNDAEQER